MNLQFPEVYKDIMSDDYRYYILYGGRSAGRSWSVARSLLIRALKDKLLILCLREYQASIRDSSHNLLRTQIAIMGLSDYYEVLETKIRCVNGSEFIFKGMARNTESIKSTEGVDIAWIEEASTMSQLSWDTITPTIRKNQSKIIATFNTRSKYDILYEQFVTNKDDDALVVFSNFKDNPFNSDVITNEATKCQVSDPDKYDNVWLGKLAQFVDGSIFKSQLAEARQQDRFIAMPVSKQKPIYTFWDLGKSDPTTIIFAQKSGEYWDIIDAYTNRLEEIEHYARYLRDTGYWFDSHNMPHDGAHERLGMHKSIIAQFEDHGVKNINKVERISDKTAGIQLSRTMFPKLRFHTATDERGVRMDRFIEALTVYRFKPDPEKQMFSNKPVHDWSSNYADALQTMAQWSDTATPDIGVLNFAKQWG